VLIAMAYTITHECIGCSVCMRVCPVDAIVGKPKARHRILAEYCIDCGACGRICPHASVKDLNGQVCERIRIRSRWPKPEFNTQRCMACTICVESCPTGCIELTPDRGTRQTLRLPVLKKARDCIGCGCCMQDCPVDAVVMEGQAV
jgi:formate hydrogenlyase subunit 6/NADH:ubiquinone oxidoreductase subunit I